MQMGQLTLLPLSTIPQACLLGQTLELIIILEGIFKIFIVFFSHYLEYFCFKKMEGPWLVWLSGLTTGLRNPRVAGSIPDSAFLGCGPGPQ